MTNRKREIFGRQQQKKKKKNSAKGKMHLKSKMFSFNRRKREIARRGKRDRGHKSWENHLKSNLL